MARLFAQSEPVEQQNPVRLFTLQELLEAEQRKMKRQPVPENITISDEPPPSRVPTQEEVQENPLGAIERFEESDISGVVPSTTREDSTPEDVRDKVLRGEPLTPLEQDMAKQMLDAGGMGNLMLGGKIREAIGQATGAAAIAGAGTMIGGAGAGALTGGPGGMVLGAMVGSAAATEVNIALGLESDSDINRVLAWTLPGLGAFGSRVVRQGVGTTRVGQFMRAARMAEIADRSIATVFRNPLRREVNAAFQAARQTPADIAFPRFINGLRRLDQPVLQDTLAQVKNVGGPAGQALEDAVLNLRRSFGTEDMITIRQSLNDLKNAHFSSESLAGKTASRTRAAELDDLMEIFDNELSMAASFGDPGAIAYREANQIARRKFAQDDMARMFNRAESPTVVGGQSTSGINIDSVLKEISQTRRAARFEVPEGTEISNMLPLMDESGQTPAFMAALEEMKRLSPKNNILILESAGGSLTRTAGLAGQTLFSQGLTETLLNPVARATMMRFLRITKGRLNIPIIAASLASGRAAAGGGIDEATQGTVDWLTDLKNLPGNIADVATQQANEPPNARAPLLKRSPAPDPVLIP